MAHPQSRSELYVTINKRLEHLLIDEKDEIAVMATVVCELYHAFPQFTWVGFYRVVAPRLLKVGPYQGGHGCLAIPFERGVCGKCARDGAPQIVADVRNAPHHIACSASTRSEIVLPIKDADGELRAVLDIDSDEPGAFGEPDREALEAICLRLRNIRWVNLKL
jgi:GAF domain-containing protein